MVGWQLRVSLLVVGTTKTSRLARVGHLGLICEVCACSGGYVIICSLIKKVDEDSRFGCVLHVVHLRLVNGAWAPVHGISQMR